jgi:hypothetical protein
MQPTIPRLILRTTPIVLSGLVLGCLIVGLGRSMLIAGPLTPFFPEALLESLAIASIAALIGLPVCLAYGLPLYALLLYKRRATYLSAFAIGAFPVLLLAATRNADWSFYGAFCVAIALATHFSARTFGPFSRALA